LSVGEFDDEDVVAVGKKSGGGKKKYQL